MCRDAPPTAGAITWSRQLARRVTDPMAVFSRSCSPGTTRLRGYDDVLARHDELVETLKSYEARLVLAWKSAVERTRTAGLGARLLRRADSATEERASGRHRLIAVNADFKSALPALYIYFVQRKISRN